MPISKTNDDGTEPKVVTEEEYRKKMESQIRENILAEIKAESEKTPVDGNKSAKPQKKQKKTTESGTGRHQFSLRLQPEMFTKLSQSADAESRSITNLIITYLDLVQHIPTWELRQILDNANGTRSRRKRR